MPQPKSKAARKALLAGQPRQNTAVIHRFDQVRDVANQMMGLKRFNVVVPATETMAHAPEPVGVTSTEYAPGHAIEDKKNEYHPVHNPRGLRPFDDAVAAAGIVPGLFFQTGAA